MRIYFGKKKFDVEAADSFVKKAVGLSGREKLGRGKGMLFTFSRSGRHGFWMHGMKFSIDIIWLDEDMRIVHIWRNAEPCRSIFGCRTVRPGKDARYVVELNSGTANALKMRLGNRFRLSQA